MRSLLVSFSNKSNLSHSYFRINKQVTHTAPPPQTPPPLMPSQSIQCHYQPLNLSTKLVQLQINSQGTTDSSLVASLPHNSSVTFMFPVNFSQYTHFRTTPTLTPINPHPTNAFLLCHLLLVTFDLARGHISQQTGTQDQQKYHSQSLIINNYPHNFPIVQLN